MEGVTRLRPVLRQFSITAPLLQQCIVLAVRQAARSLLLSHCWAIAAVVPLQYVSTAITTLLQLQHHYTSAAVTAWLHHLHGVATPWWSTATEYCYKTLIATATTLELQRRLSTADATALAVLNLQHCCCSWLKHLLFVCLSE